MSLIPPNNNTQLIVNDFILYATGHLATVSGIINTISLYPGPISPIPGPGVILWTGYQVPPALPPAPQLDVTPVLMNEQQQVISTLASLDGFAINESTTIAFGTDLSLDPPTLTLTEANNLFEASLDPTPIPEPTAEELEAEVAQLSSSNSESTPTNGESPEDTQNEDDDAPLTEEEKAAIEAALKDVDKINNPPQVNPEQVPNYNTKIVVPNDIVLAMRRWGVGKDSAKERAHFLAQCAHESGNFRAKVENLNYSASGLLNTFSKYFKTQALADSYARQPEKIASKVYADRMGNGSESTKDGWNYRGRGYIQLTGKAGYEKAEKVIKGGIVTNPSLVESKYPGDSACFFWTANNLKQYVTSNDDDSVKKLTKRINGGENGLADRKKKFLVYWNELKKDPTLWS